MSSDYFAALEDRIPVLSAEQALDAAHIAMYPHIGSSSARQWWNGMLAIIRKPMEQEALERGARYVVNGVAVNKDGLRRWFRNVLGRNGGG